MNRYRRRAFYLPQLIFLLPMIGAVLTISVLMIGSAGRFQAREHRRSGQDATLRAAMAALRADIAAARACTIEQDGTRLVLERPARTVTWELSQGRFSRTAPDDAEPPRIWPLSAVEIRFSHEPIDGSAGVIWIHVGHALPASAGPDPAVHLATAVAVGGGAP
jgi:hypothetical protein